MIIRPTDANRLTDEEQTQLDDLLNWMKVFASDNGASLMPDWIKAVERLRKVEQVQRIAIAFINGQAIQDHMENIPDA